MNVFEIKKDVVLYKDYDYLYIEKSNNMFMKKIPSRSFATLLGLNEWQSAGSEILQLLNLLEKDTTPFNNYYTLRGDVAETFTAQMLEEQFKKQFPNKIIEVILFNEKNFPFMDQFSYDPKTKKGNKVFSGRMDIAIKVREKDGKLFKAYVVEVKSKTHTTYEDVILLDEITNEKIIRKQFKKSDYEEIAINKKYPKTELYQGIFLATLGTLDKIDMVWTFFNENQEKEMEKLVDEYMKQEVPRKLPKLSFTYKDLVYHPYGYKFSVDEIKDKMTDIWRLLNSCYKTKQIPLSLFNRNDMKIIDGHIFDQKERDKKLKDFAERTEVETVDLFDEEQKDDKTNEEEVYNL